MARRTDWALVICLNFKEGLTIGRSELLCFQIDLQTTNQRISLPSKLEDANDSLEPGEHIGQVVSHEVKEVGQHMYVCFFRHLFFRNLLEFVTFQCYCIVCGFEQTFFANFQIGLRSYL